jgi:signal transduction histidine kinase/CheY-like chemotaxis protein
MTEFKSNGPDTSRFPRVHLILSAACLAYAALLLLGWHVGVIRPDGVDGYVPVAPATAIMLALLSSAMVLGDSASRLAHRPRLSLLLNLLVVGLSGYLFLQWVAFAQFGLWIDAERVLAPIGIARTGYFTSRASPVSAMLVLVLGVANLLERQTARPRWNPKRAGQILAVTVFSVSFVLITGYLFGSPPLYGGALIPVAFCTALSCFLLATALLFKGERSAFQLVFGGDSIFSLMMRIALPGSMLAVLAAGQLEQAIMGPAVDPSFFLVPAVVALLSGAVVIVLSFVAAGLVERNAQRARQEVTDAKDRLEATLVDLGRQERLIRLQAQISEAFLTLDEPELFQRILKTVMDFTESRVGLVGLADERGTIHFVALSDSVQGPCRHMGPGAGFAPPDWAGIWGHALSGHRIAYKNDGLKLSVGHMQLDRALAVPLVYREQALGVITVGGRDTDYTDLDVVQLESVTGYLGALLHGRVERKKAEADKAALGERLLQAQKMESVGRLAGGVAHDFNNLLTGITGNVALGLMELHPNSPQRQVLEEIGRAADSAAGLTRQLLAFSRKQSAAPVVLDLGDRLEQMKSLLDRLLGERLRVDLQVAQRPLRVRVDPSQFEQVLVNLVVNARDAMPQGGTIFIEAARVQLAEVGPLLGPDAVPGEFVVVRVKDSGMGMDAEVMSHLFEPFFTTKALGRGTGLGLATTYGIVRQNGGFIAVASQPGRGSEFAVHLPQVEEEATPSQAADHHLALPSGEESILLVEDEPMVRELTEKILLRQKFKVRAFASPAEALAACRSGQVQAQLLVTDVIMPGMNGRQLAQDMKALIPGLKVLYASGYGEDIIAEDGILEQGIDFIGKPFTPRELVQKVREILDRQD